MFSSFQPAPADDAAKRKKTDEPAPDDETDAAATTDTKPTDSFVASAEDEEEEGEVQNKPEDAQVQGETVGATVRMTSLRDCYVCYTFFVVILILVC